MTSVPVILAVGAICLTLLKLGRRTFKYKTWLIILGTFSQGRWLGVSKLLSNLASAVSLGLRGL